ncbi:hypothetical protein QUF72_14330 [Desulfobacterales bacterium HSG2]|nr:hypothetical protein [Desulfobacterales bacterium HSG2]
MIELTPIEETLVGRELIQIGKTLGKKEGKKEGMRKGELIGEIRMARRILRRPRIPKDELSRMSLRKLRDILKEMESELYRD